MMVKLLTEQLLEFLSFTGGCRGLSESALANMSNCWKSHAAANHEMDDPISMIQLTSSTGPAPRMVCSTPDPCNPL